VNYAERYRRELCEVLTEVHFEAYFIGNSHITKMTLLLDTSKTPVRQAGTTDMPRTYGQISVMSVRAKDKPKKIESSFLALFNIENDPPTGLTAL
jgi:hypothetical protein